MVPWGLGDRMDRGNEGACVGNGAIPETVLSGPLGDRMDRGNEGAWVGHRATLGTRGPDGQRE